MLLGVVALAFNPSREAEVGESESEANLIFIAPRQPELHGEILYLKIGINTKF